MNIKFVSYTGSYPNLCSGTLVLNINGEDMTFGYTGQYSKFWQSGGHVDVDSETVECGLWELVSEPELYLPKFLAPHADELIRVFNENVECGCCGGCL